MNEEDFMDYRLWFTIFALVWLGVCWFFMRKMKHKLPPEEYDIDVRYPFDWF